MRACAAGCTLGIPSSSFETSHSFRRNPQGTAHPKSPHGRLAAEYFTCARWWFPDVLARRHFVVHARCAKVKRVPKNLALGNAQGAPQKPTLNSLVVCK